MRSCTWSCLSRTGPARRRARKRRRAMPSESDPLLPVVRVGEIDGQDNTPRWLVEQLWGESAVGVIGGAPKCSKTWLGLDMALSVATGTACLGKYAVPEAGPGLGYPPEGPPPKGPGGARG